jgi:hypothetical protein
MNWCAANDIVTNKDLMRLLPRLSRHLRVMQVSAPGLSWQLPVCWHRLAPWSLPNGETSTYEKG